MANAQVSGQIGLTTDTVFRGVSLSQGRVEPTLSAAYDGSSGLFGGALIEGTPLASPYDTQALSVFYAGFAHRLSDQVTGELGGTAYHFLPSSEYNYVEGFAGLATKTWSLRAYYSANYLGSGIPTIYTEINNSQLIFTDTHLIAHAGILSLLNGVDGGSRQRFDLRLGVSFDFKDMTCQMSWNRGSPPTYIYPFAPSRSLNEVVFSISYLL